MNDLLSQEEIDALLSSVGTQPAEEEARPAARTTAAGGDKRSYRIYDFTSPDKFSKDQMRTLQMIHDNFTRFLNSTLSAYLRTVVQSSLVQVLEKSYEEFIRELANPSVIGIFSMPPLEGSAVLETNPTVVFSTYDRLLGGRGEPPLQVRELTDIEQSVVEGVFNRVLRALKEGWRSVTDFEPKLESLETNPAFVSIAAPNDRVAAMSFELKIGETSGVMNLCIPHIVVEPIASKLSAQLWFSGANKGGTDETRRTIKRSLDRAKLQVIAELGKTRLPLRELLEIKNGDVLRLDQYVGDPLKIKIGDSVKFAGQAGTIKGKVAVQVTGKLEEPEHD